MKKLKQRLKNDTIFKGTFLSLGSPITSEIISKTGFDFAILDLEHGAGNEKDILNQLHAMGNGTTTPIVRVESSNHERVHRVLDMGAEGIMFPRIKSVEQTKEAVNALRYAPEGLRGVAKLVRATNYGSNWNDYYSNQKEHILGIIQIETEEILDNLDEIAQMDGVDVLFVGPMDLSMALGIFGQFDHPKFIEAIKLTAKAAEKAGKVCGILLTNENQLPNYYNLGYRFFTLGSDLGFVNQGAITTLEKMNIVSSKL